MGCVVSISECLIELEPMVRKFDEIDFLEAVLEIKRAKVSLPTVLFLFEDAFHTSRSIYFVLYIHCCIVVFIRFVFTLTFLQMSKPP